jgi:hypothetical protein
MVDRATVTMTSVPLPFGGSSAMSESHTATAAVQRYLDALAGDTPADPIIRALRDRAVRRLESLCVNQHMRWELNYFLNNV